MLEGMGIKIVRDEVMKIDRQNKTVLTATNDSFAYDKLYLATGSSSFIPPSRERTLKA